MSRLRYPIVMLVLAWGIGPSATVAAAAIPAQAMNKTITISFGVTGTSKRADGQTINFNNVITRQIYVSTAGRLFMRHEAQSLRNRNLHRGGEFAPGDARPGRGNFNFQGNQLVGVIPYPSGARQIVATFDSGFSSCTVSVIEGRSGGTAIRRKGPDGAMHELQSVSVVSPSCSVQSGNAFAGE